MFSQVGKADCPEFLIVGPAGISNIGDDVYFEVEFDDETDLRSLVLEWTVQGGKLFEGQGTSKVRVSTNNASKQGKRLDSIVVQLKINGLPAGCKSTLSESAPLIEIPSFCLDEFGELDLEDELGRWDTFFAELQNNPTHLGFILIYIDSEDTRDSGMDRVSRVIKHAEFRKFDKSRLEFGISRAKDKRTQYWRIPEGGDYPPCDHCEIIKGRFQ